MVLIALSIPIVPINSLAPTKTTQSTPIKVGIFSPYPGASALSIYGGWTVQGFQLGLMYATDGTNATIAGRPFELHYYDTATDPTTATTAATSAITTDGIDILVGGTSSSVAAAIQTVAAQYHKLYFITPGADSSLTGANFNKYSFRLARNSYQDAITGIDYAWNYTGARHFAIIAPNYAFGYGGAQAMQKEVANHGGVTVDTIYVPLGTTDFTPYMDRLITDNATYGVDMLMVIWAGAGFNYLYGGLADKNIASYMNISSGVIDTASMDYIQSTMTSGTLIGQTGLAVYGYKLPNNPVNDWLVQQSISRKVTSDSGFAGSPANIYGMNFSKLYIPELFTPDGFATAEFLVNITNAVTDLNVDNMICGLEGMTLATPKGMETIRAQDHQGLPEMYVATIINDTTPSSPSYGHLIGQLVKTMSPESVAPPIETTYQGCNPSSVITTTISGTVITTTLPGSGTTSVSSTTKTVSVPGFMAPLFLLGLVMVVFAIKNKNKINLK